MNRIFILNPVSGKGRNLKYIGRINKIFKNTGDNIIIEQTQKPNDVRRIINKYVEKYGANEIVCYIIGGDGTLSESLSIAIAKNIKIVPVPAGTGNDYVRSIYKYKSGRTILKKSIECKRYRRAGVMQTLNGYALNVISCGFDAKVGENIKYFKKLPFITGSFAYHLSILYTLFSNKNYKFKIRIDDKVFKGKYTLVAIGKGKYYGGGVKILPDAKVTDKKMQVCIARQTTVLEKLHFLPKLKKARHGEINGVEFFECDSISIVSTRKFPISLDGEVYLDNKLKVTSLPRTLRIPII